MNPVQLLRATDLVPVAVACGMCGRHWSLRDEHAQRFAALCCDAVARQADEAARQAESDRRMAALEARRIAEARRVPEAEYRGPVYCEGLGHDDGYFASADDLREWCEDEGVAVPAEVWGCAMTRFRLPAAQDLIDREADGDEYHEGIADQVTAVDELQAALDAWNAKQTACSYSVDWRVRVVLGLASDRGAPAGEAPRGE